MSDQPIDESSTRLTVLQPDEGVEVRRFCLATIREVLGYQYRADWHEDIDALLEPVHCYHPARRGAFVVARRDGTIVGCGGLRALASHQRLADRFASRYCDLQRVGSVWRVYVSAEQRRRGLGGRIFSMLESEAVRHGYDQLYLHTSGRTPRSVAFWQNQGFVPFAHDTASPDATIHLDKITPGARPGRSGLRALRGPGRSGPGPQPAVRS